MTDDKEQIDLQDADFADRAGRRLRVRVETLDAATQSRLNQARQRALAEMDRGHGRVAGRPRWLAPVAAAVVAALALGVLNQRGPDQIPADSLVAESADPADFELLLDEEGLELMEGLEFYAWLDEEMLDANTPLTEPGASG